MRKLNPGKVAIMIVDRIPLVYQQANAIFTDTGMTVLPLCSETDSMSVRKLADGYTYDACVATAGSLYSILIDGRCNIAVSMFCVMVFDECHHASG